MEIVHRNNQDGGFFFAEEDGSRIGYMSYEWNGQDTFAVTHTVVDEAFRGRGVAKALLDAAVAYARGSGCKIVPLCSYVGKVFLHDASYNDVKA